MLKSHRGTVMKSGRGGMGEAEHSKLWAWVCSISGGTHSPCSGMRWAAGAAVPGLDWGGGNMVKPDGFTP